jgi:hypothetical protein
LDDGVEFSSKGFILSFVSSDCHMEDVDAVLGV